MLIFLQTYSFANQNYAVFCENNLFGLKDNKGNVIIEPEFKKMITLGASSWIIQKKNKFGIIDSNGIYLVKPKYTHADRVFNKYAKLGNEKDYGIHDETGKEIIPHEYSLIEPMFGKLFVTCKNYKYGVIDFDGNIIFENVFEAIYMPTPKTMRIKYQGEWSEIEAIDKNSIERPDENDILSIGDKDFTVKNIVINTGIISGYSVITFTDYVLKIISSISPAYEATIDELMFSKGADTVPVIMKFSWLPKFPIVYVKKYISIFKAPNNGPLNDVKENIIQRKK